MKRRTFTRLTAGAALAPALVARASAQTSGAPEKARVILGVGGKPLLYYLPLTIAERRGFFEEQGLGVWSRDEVARVDLER